MPQIDAVPFIMLEMDYVEHQIQNRTVFARSQLEDCQLSLFDKSFGDDSKPEQGSEGPGVLGGRTTIQLIDYRENQTIVLKRYRRGGFLRHFNQATYFGRPPRPQIEFECLEQAGEAGLSVPRPIAFIIEGGLWYRGGLFLEHLPFCQTLVQWSEKASSKREEVISELRRQVSCLLGMKLHHVDFHPGNVLVDHQQRVYVIDFDKARYWRNTTRELQHQYRKRWDRAILKYSLPTWLLWEELLELV